MPKVDPKAAEVYVVEHMGIGAIGELGPWAKGHHIAREHFPTDHLPHLDRLVDLGAVKPVEGDDLDTLKSDLAEQGMEIGALPKNPWTDNENANVAYKKLVADRKALAEATAPPVPVEAKPHRQIKPGE